MNDIKTRRISTSAFSSFYFNKSIFKRVKFAVTIFVRQVYFSNYWKTSFTDFKLSSIYLEALSTTSLMFLNKNRIVWSQKNKEFCTIFSSAHFMWTARGNQTTKLAFLPILLIKTTENQTQTLFHEWKTWDKWSIVHLSLKISFKSLNLSQKKWFSFTQLKTICEFKTWILIVQNIEYFDISKQLNIFKLYKTL